MKEPMYKQIENYLKSLIEEKKLKEGDLLPSENQLCEMFSVTRMTVRAALNNLVTERYIEKRKGIGSVVTREKIYDNIGKVSGFTKEMLDKGFNVATKVEQLEIIEADETISNKLNIPLNENVWKVNRVRLANDLKVSYMTTYMPQKMFSDLSRKHCEGSLYKYIEEDCGYKIARSERTVEAVISSKELKRVLSLEKDEAILHIEQISILENGEIFEYSHTFHHNYKLTLNASI